MRNILSFMAAMMLVQILFAQEKEVPLRDNYVQSYASKHLSKINPRSLVSLPFVDDFSYLSPIPKPTLWLDHQAYVNNQYGNNAPSYGVATLDGLDQNGRPYDSTAFSFNAIGGADTLTSQPIALGFNSPADSVYFSFYYQPGGNGEFPNTYQYNFFNGLAETGDSLILEFRNKDSAWVHVWASDGDSMSKPFKQVIIGLKDPQYFYDGFQFRFRNIALLIGNYDLWNIDYVRLNANRTYNDTALSDVAVQSANTSLLGNYQRMPWNQFVNNQSQELYPFFGFHFRNNSVFAKNATFQASLYDSAGTNFFTSNPISFNFDALSTVKDSVQISSIPSVPAGSFPTVLSKVTITTSADNNVGNDTLIQPQIFGNELSYDDGTAENQYEFTASLGEVAYGFHLNVPDTLRAIEIQFVHNDFNILQQPISILVWKTLNDADTIYHQDFVSPQYSSEHGGFTRFRLTRPVAVQDSFYIGWLQAGIGTTPTISIGLDAERNADAANLYYKIANGDWNRSAIAGSALMRAVVGPPIPFGVGITEVKNQAVLKIFPNPATDRLYFQLPWNEKSIIEIFDAEGNLMMKENLSENSVNISALRPGFYALKIQNTATAQWAASSFIKN